MPRAFPVRSETHQLEDQSVRFFCSCLPNNWTCEKPTPDYGVDLRVDIYEDRDATGLELLVQLKASKAATAGETEIAQLRTASYNYLRGKLQVKMLVKFVVEDGDGYWLLFRDIPPPNQANDTFSVRIPTSNRLSTIEWAEIQRYVRKITDRKLAAIRKEAIGRNEAG